MTDPSLSSLVYVPNDVFQENCVTFATRYAFSDLNIEQEREDEGRFMEDVGREQGGHRGTCSQPPIFFKGSKVPFG